MKRFLVFLTFAAPLPAFSQAIDREQDFRVAAVWREIERQPYAKAHSGMPAIDQIIIRNTKAQSSVMGLMQRKNWLAGDNLDWENGFSVMIARPCFHTLPECYVAQGLWLEQKKKAGK